MTEIRRLRPGDEEAARAFTALYADPDAGPGDLAAWLANPHNVMVGAFKDGAPAGMAYGHVLERPDDRPDMLLLYSIDVGEAFRRRGIGTALTRAFAAEGADGAWLVTNVSNEAAMRMYGAAGGERPHDDDAMFRIS